MQQQITFILFLITPCVVSCLFFLWEIIRTIYNIINYFICKKRYSGLVNSHLDMCRKCEENLNNNKDLYKTTLINFIQSIYMCEII